MATSWRSCFSKSFPHVGRAGLLFFPSAPLAENRYDAMKTFIAFLLCALSFSLAAADAVPANLIPQDTDGGYELQLKSASSLGLLTMPGTATIPLSVVTNVGSATWLVETNIYHTIHLVSSGTTTNLTLTLSRTLDATNYFPFATNTITSDTTAEVTATGAWKRFKAVVTFAVDTNGAVAVHYFGKR